MPELPTFLQQLTRAWPPEVWRDVTVLVAVSGGPDSVALLSGLAAIRLPGSGQLIAAHFNHGLRGEQSDADEAFVVDLCRRRGISCEVGRADQAAGPQGLPDEDRERGSRSEAHLRAARYHFLSATARRVGARYVATGHTADDQAETVLLRILRGTGIAGLAGIRRHRQLLPGVSLVRPLLNVSRSLAREYLQSLGQGYREDSSNADLRYTRNRVRHELLPHLADQYNAGIVAALTRLAGLAEDVQAIAASLLGDLQRRCVRIDSPFQVTVDCRGLAAVPRYLVRELLIAVWQQQGWPLQAMGYERWEQLADLACPTEPPATDWTRVFPGSISAERDGPWLRLLALPADQAKSLS
jgi:tRNA(Ile)-lysidine synthase